MTTKRDLRFFNTTGPCNPDDHYMLPPENRLVGAQLSRYISDKLYWVLHAPRQTGKTTFLQSWMREINAGDEAVACYVSVESCRNISDAERTMPAICEAIRFYADSFKVPVPELSTTSTLGLLNNMLNGSVPLLKSGIGILYFKALSFIEEHNAGIARSASSNP